MNYGIFGNLGTWNRMFPFTFKPRKFGCFELVTMATEKQSSKQRRFLTLQKTFCKNKQQIQNLDGFN